MNLSEQQNPSETIRLLRRAVDGDDDTWHALMDRHRARLQRMVRIRLDQRMQSRVDPSDVIQDAFVEAWAKLPQYLDDPKISFFLWLRSITGHKLMTLHRFHLGAEKRAAGKEISLFRNTFPATTTAALAAHLVGGFTQPSQAAMKAEMKIRLQEALNSLEEIDREILTLRHLEQLTNAETAEFLQVPISTASKRYVRSLKRLKQVMSA